MGLGRGRIQLFNERTKIICSFDQNNETAIQNTCTIRNSFPTMTHESWKLRHSSKNIN